MSETRTTPSPVDVAAGCLFEELSQLGADAGYIGRPGPSQLSIEVARVTPFSPLPVRLAFPATALYPLVQALRSGSPLFIGSNEQLECDHPGLIRVVAEDHACATFPLRAGDGAVVGAVNFAFEEPREFTDDDRNRIAAAADRCAKALVEAVA